MPAGSATRLARMRLWHTETRRVVPDCLPPLTLDHPWWARSNIVRPVKTWSPFARPLRAPRRLSRPFTSRAPTRPTAQGAHSRTAGGQSPAQGALRWRFPRRWPNGSASPPHPTLPAFSLSAPTCRGHTVSSRCPPSASRLCDAHAWRPVRAAPLRRNGPLVLVAGRCRRGAGAPGCPAAACSCGSSRPHPTERPRRHGATFRASRA